MAMSALALALAVSGASAVAQEGPARFSDAAAGAELPKSWRQLEFPGVKRPTHWRLVEDGESVVLSGSSVGGASLVYSATDLDPVATPVVNWRWKVASTVADGDLSTRKADDAAARVYIAFQWDPKLEGPWQKIVGPWQRMKYRLARSRYGEMPPFAAIVYVWSHNEPVGWTAANPSFERSIQVVKRTREDPTGIWVDESSNVVEDFRSWFGFDPPPVSHVALMVDTDDTDGETEAWFGDLVFTRE
jgi:hypothetical protein